MRLPLLAVCLGCFLAGPALVDYSVFYDPAQDLPPEFRLDLPAERGKALEARAAACRWHMTTWAAGVCRRNAGRWSGASR
jgi:hypothetical protein